jgi:hypothetical protein
MNFIQDKYTSLCSKPSDINEHLPTLFEYAKECNSVFETGVRGVVSSWALLFGLLMNNNNQKKTFLMNDIDPCELDEIFNIAKELNIDIAFKLENNLLIDFKETEKYDLTFIDTFHVYPQLIRELNKFSQVTNKYIIMHDTTVDEFEGELIRNCGGYNSNRIDETSKNTGFSPEDLCKGLRPAIEEFLINNKNWQIKEVFTNNNGLTILEKLF